MDSGEPVLSSDGIYAWSPISTRPNLQWPTGAAVAVAVITLIEYVEFESPADRPVIRLPGAASVRVHPNLLFRSHREYGARVGVFRVLEALRNCGIRPAIAIDAESAVRYPFVVQRCVEADAEFIAHGTAATNPLSARMTTSEERQYIATSRRVIEAAVPRPVEGWYGPEQSESLRTPFLLDALGFKFVCDWPNDDQPYAMDTPGKLISVPTALTLDDAGAMLTRTSAPSRYTDLVRDGFDALVADARHCGGCCMVLVVRPWLTGRPFQIEAFERAVAHVVASGSAWLTTPGEIAATYRQLVIA